ncbi:MAG: M14 family metallopeptidase [Planctomycetota bacterium]|jgi:hypothetical protein
MRNVTRALLPAFLLLGASLPGARADEAPSLDGITFDRYYDVEQLAAAMQEIRDAYPDRTRLESMGRSREGRELWVMTVFDPAAGNPDTKPGMYVDGNTHGNEVQGAEVCLFLIKYLLTKDDPWIRDLLRRVTFYVAPCVNPDSRHRFFHDPNDPHSPRRVLRPYDDDRDGTADEDGPDDLDGDGHILRMRVRDPNGGLVVDERDDRLLRERRPGEQGAYRMLGSEGTDEDGDGRINEDGEGGVDPNRNWPAQWRPERDQRGAGPYPLSEPETRATALWILAHPHIAGVQSFHNAGRMILRPPAAWTDEELDMPAGDVRIFDEVARQGLHVLPTYRWMQVREDLYQVFGGFVAWTYLDLGIFSFTNEIWGHLSADVPPQEPVRNLPGGRPLPRDGAEESDPRLAALRWNDAVLHGEGFVRWREVPHPQYGTVEVGGWKRFTIRTNPPDFLHDSCVRNTLFVLQHAAALPHLAIRDVARIEGEAALRVTVTNDALFPTVHEMARRHDTLPPDTVGVADGRVLAALRVVPGETGRVLDVKGGKARLPDGVPGHGEVQIVLYVDGDPSAVVVESRLGGIVRSELP